MEITLKNLQKKAPIPRSQILQRATAASRRLRLKLQGLSIVFVGPQRMRMINKKYLNHDYVTDVLTFDLGSGLAEIIVCPQTASMNAEAYKTSTCREIILYVIHGLLHLAGYDDHSPKDVLNMRRMEGRLSK